MKRCSVCGEEKGNLIPVRHDIEECVEEIGETFYHGWEVRKICSSCYEDGDYDVVIYEKGSMKKS